MESLVNFRDIGNIPTEDGKRVKSGLFLRSGEVVNVQENIINHLLNEYNLKTIVDFRGKHEIDERPDDVIEGVDYINIDILKDVKKQGAGFDDFLKRTSSAEEGMFDLYEELVLSKKAQKGYQQFLERILMSPESPLLFHCFAGKDRTGFAAALILKSLGVMDDLIMKDYLKTNEMRKTANQAIIDELKNKGLTKEQLEGVLVMLNVDKRYLRHSFDIINKEFGGFKEYMINGLQLSPSFFDEMKRLYTA